MHVGNDVVDLTDPEAWPGATHPRFAERVLAPEELATLAHAPHPNRRLWAYWAAKESAFKAFRKIAPALPFAPCRFRVTFHAASQAKTSRAVVRTRHLAAAVEIEETWGYVHAVATALPASNAADTPSSWRVESGVRRLPAVDGAAPFTSVGGGESGCGRCCPGTVSLSDAGRRFLVQRLAAGLACRPGDLQILPSPRRGLPPGISFRGRSSNVDVSLAHHGRLVAFAFALPANPADAAIRPATHD